MEAVPEYACQLEKCPRPEHIGIIEVNTKIVRPDYEDSSILISLPTNEFTDVEDSPHKERLYYFLKDLGVDARDARQLIQQLTLYVCKVTSLFVYRPHYALSVFLTLKLHVAPSSIEGLILDDPQVVVSYLDDFQVDESFIHDPLVESLVILDDSRLDESFIDDFQLEEVIQASLDEDDERRNSEFRPARKLRVDALSRRIYKRKQKTSKIGNQCTRYKRRRKTISSDDDICPVCLKKFRDGRKVATLLCGHEFHNRCIMKWIKIGHNCPLCRFDLTREEDDEFPQQPNTIQFSN